jgi:aspartate dehydrogenase
MKDILMIGCGAMGRSVLEALRNEAQARVRYVLERPSRAGKLQDELGGIQVLRSLDELDSVPDLLLECAGHEAVATLVPAFLEKGVTTIIASVGALAAPGVPECLERAARKGEARLIVVPGAIAGIDALSAASQVGLRSVVYVGRKPPAGWLGTAAEGVVDLRALLQPAVIFDGDAREAARRYPRNANVAAAVALAGVGMEQTRVSLIADPGVSRNTHQVHAVGDFGELHVTVSAEPLADNPKTSALAALSILRAVRNEFGWMVL